MVNSSVIIRFEILLWLSGCENFSGPSRNGAPGLSTMLYPLLTLVFSDITPQDNFSPLVQISLT